MKRFTGEGDAPDRLDAILFEAFDALRAARAVEDARIVAVSKMRGLRERFPIAASPAPNSSCSNWRLPWRTGSITRPTTAVRLMRF